MSEWPTGTVAHVGRGEGAGTGGGCSFPHNQGARSLSVGLNSVRYWAPGCSGGQEKHSIVWRS